MGKSYLEQLQELSSKLEAMSSEEIVALFDGGELSEEEVAQYSTMEQYLVSWSYSPQENLAGADGCFGTNDLAFAA